PRDTIYGTVNIRGGVGRETHEFSCMVNTNTGRILSTRIDPGSPGSNGRYREYGDRGPISSLSDSAAINNCERAVRDRMRRDGFAGGVQFDSINADNRPGRNDWVVGTVRSGRELFNF